MAIGGRPLLTGNTFPDTLRPRFFPEAARAAPVVLGVLDPPPRYMSQNENSRIRSSQRHDPPPVSHKDGLRSGVRGRQLAVNEDGDFLYMPKRSGHGGSPSRSPSLTNTRPRNNHAAAENAAAAGAPAVVIVEEAVAAVIPAVVIAEEAGAAVEEAGAVYATLATVETDGGVDVEAVATQN